MSNSFYNHGAFPSTGSAATSASMRAELDLVAAGFDKMPTLAGNANKFIIVNSTGTGLTQTDVLPAFTVTDTDFTVQDDGDNTRKFKFNAGSITTGNTRTYVMPDLDTTLVGTTVTQTLTNKTLTAPVIATIVNTGTLTLPTSTDTLVGRNTTDTLTNKTLTNPVIGTIVNTGTLTLPTSTDTLVGRQTTDTLTNKTISGASNTLSNIANGSLSNSSIVIGSTTLSLGGTMTTLAGVTISGASNTLSNIANASLTNSAITINGSTVALGSSVTVTATATNALTIGNGLSGTSYNGSSAVTIAINTGVTADLSTAQTFSNKTISGSANTLTNIANASLTNSAITIGSTAISLGATSLTIAGLTSASATTLISTGNQATSVAISAIGHSSGTVTVTTGTAHGLTTGDTASIDGVADYTFCGVYTVTVTNANVFTYSQTAGGASSSGGFSTKLTGTWGLYAGGTGPSLHNGPVIVSASSQMPALRVTQGGSGYALIVEDAANPDTSAFIISNAGDLAINTNKFTVAAASGNTVIAGTTSLNGNVTFATDATYDIGASGATRPRDLFLSRNLVVGGTLTLAGGVNLNGNVTVGDASTDTLTINSTITSNLIFTDNTYDIGASGATRPRNLYLAGLLTMGGALSVTGATTLTGALNANGNVTIGDASSDTLTINSTITSNLLFTDNTYDIGASGATRPRNLYLAGNAVIAGSTTLSGGTANGVLYLNGSKVATSGSALTYDAVTLANDTGSTGGTTGFSASNSVANGYTALTLRNTGASGKTYEVGVGGNGVATPYQNNFYIRDTTGSPLLYLNSASTFVTNSFQNIRAAGTDNYINYSTNGVNNTVMGFNNSGSTNGTAVVNNTAYFGSLNAYSTAVVGNGALLATFVSSAQGAQGINVNGAVGITQSSIFPTVGFTYNSNGYLYSMGGTSGAITQVGGVNILNVTGTGVGVSATPSFLLDVGNGTTVGTGIMRLNGRDAVSEGAYIRFDKNGVQNSIIGMQSGIIGASTSSNLMLWTKAGTGLSIATGGATANPAFFIGSGGNVSIGAGSTINQDFGYTLGTAEAAKAQLAVLSTAGYAAGVGGAISLGGNYRNTGDFQPFTRIAAEKTNGTDGNFSYNMSFYTTQYAGATFGVKAMTIFDTGQITVFNTGVGMTFSSSGGNGLRIYGSSGTDQWDQYLNGANIRLSNNTGTTGSRLTVDQGISSSGNNMVAPNSGNPSGMYAFQTSTNNGAYFSNLVMGRSGGEYGSVGYGMGYDTGTINTYYYNTSDTASMIRFNNGKVETLTAAGGTAGNTISFTTGPYVAQGGTSWTNSSDERRKVILEPITNALAKVRAVRKVIGRFKDDPETKRRSFFIAQDFLQQFPEVVDVPETDFDERTGQQWLGIQYTDTIPLIAAALEELADAFDSYVANHP